MRQGIFLFAVFFLFLPACGYHRPDVRVLPDSEKEDKKILFIAFDGIGYDMMAELKREGYFRDFRDPVPFIVTFPSGTTTGFTGIFKPLDVGLVPGYETRFYSFRANKVVGGTPWDIYRIPITYKTYFDSFRHTIYEKSMMYSFPGVAGRQDLANAEKLLLQGGKKVLFSYLGGTDGAQHILGRNRTKRFMIFADKLIRRMKKNYARTHNTPLMVVLFSDHGFHFEKLKMVSTGDIASALKKGGLATTHHLEDKNGVVLVKYGLLSSGVVMTHPEVREKTARLIGGVDGIDLVFWADGNKVHVVGSLNEEAFFEYRWPGSYRYVSIRGDPLGYEGVLEKHGYRMGEWVPDKKWRDFTWNEEYPDAGYRLYESFHNLVENRASVLFSTEPGYQFGGLAALAGTKLKPGGHKGTHGGLFRDVSQGMVMTDDGSVLLPQSIRYDELFKIFLPRVTDAYRRRHGKKEIQFLATESH